MANFSFLENKVRFSQLKNENLFDQTTHLINSLRPQNLSIPINEKRRSHSVSKNNSSHIGMAENLDNLPFLNLTQNKKMFPLYKNKNNNKKNVDKKEENIKSNSALMFKKNVIKIKNHQSRSNEKCLTSREKSIKKKIHENNLEGFKFFETDFQVKNENENLQINHFNEQKKINKYIIEILDLIMRKANIRLLNSFAYETKGELERRKTELRAKILCYDEELGGIVKKIEDYIDLILNINDENKVISQVNTIEIEKLSDLARRCGIKDEEIKQKISQKDFEKDPSMHAISLDFLNKFEDIYKKKIEQAQNSFEALEYKLVKVKAKKKNLKSQLKTFLKVDESKKHILHKNASTQIDSVIIPHLNPELSLISSYLNKVYQPFYELPHSFIISLINLILSNKIIDDFASFQNNIPIPNLADYLSIWMSKYFGGIEAADNIFNDFLINLKINKSDNKKIRLFRNLLGIEKNKHDCFEDFAAKSVFAERICIKLAYFQKFESEKIDKDPQSPLFPDLEDCNIKHNKKNIFYIENFKQAEICIKNFMKYKKNIILLDYMDCEEAYDYFIKIFQEYKMENEYLFRIQKIFEDKIKSGFFKCKKKGGRISGGESSPTKKIASLNSLLIDLDDVCLFVIEQYQMYFSSKMRDTISLLNILHRNNEFFSLSLEDFTRAVEKNFHYFPKTLIHRIYSDLVLQIKNAPNSTLPNIFLSLSERFLDTFVYYEFYLKANSSFEEFEIKNYDIYSSLIALKQTYEIFRQKIIVKENLIDDLAMNHDIFKKEISRMPNISKNFTKFSSLLSGYQRKELIERINNCWKNMRKILKVLSQK